MRDVSQAQTIPLPDDEAPGYETEQNKEETTNTATQGGESLSDVIIQQLLSRLEAVEQDNGDLKSLVETLTSHLSDFKNEADTLKVKNYSLENTVSELKKSQIIIEESFLRHQSEFKKKIKTLEEKADDMKSKYNSLSQEHKNLKADFLRLAEKYNDDIICEKNRGTSLSNTDK